MATQLLKVIKMKIQEKPLRQRQTPAATSHLSQHNYWNLYGASLWTLARPPTPVSTLFRVYEVNERAL